MLSIILSDFYSLRLSFVKSCCLIFTALTRFMSFMKLLSPAKISTKLTSAKFMYLSAIFRAKSLTRKTASSFIIVLLFTSLSYSAEIPRANLDEAERYFNNAYLHFMRRNYRDAQVFLDQAIRENTYMVDYYLLNSLNLNRLGYSDNAISAVKSYLEVRPMDSSAPRILRSLEEQNQILRAIIGTGPIPMSWRRAETTVQTEWNTGYTRPFSIRGLGKIRSLGEVVTIPDTFGDNIYIRGSSRNPVSGNFFNSGGLRKINVPSPVIAIPMGDGTFTIFNADGEIYSLRNLSDRNIVSADYLTTIPSIVISDAELISQNMFAISDPADRNIAFYRASATGLNVRFWTPPLREGEFLFEPVAIESFADWLAVADRANERVYILNITSQEYFDIREVPKPRDLIWSPLGELFILSEEGQVYEFEIDFGARLYFNKNASTMYEGLENIWSFFHSPEGDINFMDIGASRIYKAIMMPSREDMPGFLSIYNPVTATNVENNESFIIDATLMSPYVNYSHNTRIIAQAVWNERNMRCNVLWQRPMRFDGVLIHSAVPRSQAFPLNVRPAQVNRGSDINSVLASLWLLHNETLTNVIVDASIPMTMQDLQMLLQFCLNNGLELDIWARDVPSLGLTRASGFTGGRTIYSIENTLELPVQRTHMQIQIPLPVELSSSGYPGRSMLAVYFDAGLIQSRAWMPLYPDMFER